MVHHLTINTQATYELQLQHLTEAVLVTKQQLDIWSDKIIDIQALQMDEAIDIDEETNKTIDMMQDYIIKYQHLLQYMTEKVISTKHIMARCGTQDHRTAPISTLPSTPDI